jgi:EpsI family protein
MRPEEVPLRLPLAELPMQLGEWTGSAAQDFDNEVLEVLGVDDYVTRVYSAGGDAAASAPVPYRMGLYIGYYRSQRQGDTIHSPMNCLPGAGWQPIDVSALVVNETGARSEVNRVVIQKGEHRQVVLYWYQGRGRIVADEYASRAYLVWDAATRNRSDGALVRVISPVLSAEHDYLAAERRAVAFVRLLSPHLKRFLPD